ncbi:DUF4169 family protein [Brevundimonas lutea]|uniref:DUF4169 family protein n=1 Tax=Brevundimonas lutea TaxID=2293980 RepID=UPI000F0438E0|nr:DUF4169 family protein [Brevundimonas lutea]
MGEIVNLRQARKTRDRVEARARAAEARAAHGRSKTAQRATDAEREAVDRALDGARRDRPEDA